MRIPASSPLLNPNNQGETTVDTDQPSVATMDPSETEGIRAGKAPAPPTAGESSESEPLLGSSTTDNNSGAEVKDESSTTVNADQDSKADVKTETAEDTSNATPGGGTSNDRSAQWECQICLDDANEPVVSHCGHLFCWACLAEWLRIQGAYVDNETAARNPAATQITAGCPVCNAAISRNKVTPIYGRGQTSQRDPRDTPLPPRPQAQREERPSGVPRGRANLPGGATFTGTGAGQARQAHFSIGAGFFPFPTLFAMQFSGPSAQPTGNGDDPTTTHPRTAQEAQFQAIAQAFQFAGLVMILAFIFGV
eukprot:Clim_evm71s201 gene=Clim_evmTU71s201